MTDEQCSGRMKGEPHIWKPVRSVQPDRPDDLEWCLACNAERSVPYEFVGDDAGGNAIYRRRNLLIGGYDYYSNACGAVTLIVDASTHAQELLRVVADMMKNR